VYLHLWVSNFNFYDNNESTPLMWALILPSDNALYENKSLVCKANKSQSSKMDIAMRGLWLWVWLTSDNTDIDIREHATYAWTHHVHAIFYESESSHVKFTIYQETLTKGKFDVSWPNHQTKTIQYKATIYF